MIWLVSGSTQTVRRHPHLGVLIVPAERRKSAVPVGRPWAMDNGCFTGFTADLFVTMLQHWAGVSADRSMAPCLFVTAPDVVGDAQRTREQWAIWAPVIRRWGFPVAYVIQDGTPSVPVPWDCDAVFIGGSTQFKLSSAAATVAAYARARGKWVHMGRVNGGDRFHHARAIGCQSVDGTGFSMFGDEYVRRDQQWRSEEPRPAAIRLSFDP